jgi:hypothetical protein
LTRSTRGPVSHQPRHAAQDPLDSAPERLTTRHCVANAMAQAPPLTLIFPGKRSAPIRRTDPQRGLAARHNQTPPQPSLYLTPGTDTNQLGLRRLNVDSTEIHAEASASPGQPGWI